MRTYRLTQLRASRKPLFHKILFAAARERLLILLAPEITVPSQARYGDDGSSVFLWQSNNHVSTAFSALFNRACVFGCPQEHVHRHRCKGTNQRHRNRPRQLTDHRRTCRMSHVSRPQSTLA